MSCPTQEQWDLLAMEVLEGEPAEQMLIHADACPACRTRLYDARRAHIERVRMYEAFDRNHDELREQLMTTLPEAPPAVWHRLPAGESLWHRFSTGEMTGSSWRRLGDLAMRLTKSAPRRAAAVLLPAAVIVLAVVAYFGSERSAFAAALEHMRQASTIIARFQSFMNDSDVPMIEGTMYMSSEQGMFFDMGASGETAMLMYRQPDGPFINVHPKMNMVMRMYGNFDEIEGMDQPSPDAFIRKFLEMADEAEAELGRSVVDGVKVEGYEISGKTLGLDFVGSRSGSAETDETVQGSVARLWIDVATQLPVRMEVELYLPMLGGRFSAVYDNFEWDQPLDAALFEPQIPEDAREVEVTIPTPSEQTLIDGLTQASELLGRFPMSLDPMRIGAEYGMAAAGRLIAEGKQPDPVEIMEEVTQGALTINMGCVFVQQLSRDGHEPEYFGDIVYPEDADDVLLHWTLDDGSTRVIYGDLRAETLPASD